jgi:hypothetical protein
VTEPTNERELGRRGRESSAAQCKSQIALLIGLVRKTGPLARLDEHNRDGALRFDNRDGVRRQGRTHTVCHLCSL